MQTSPFLDFIVGTATNGFVAGTARCLTIITIIMSTQMEVILPKTNIGQVS